MNKLFFALFVLQGTYATNSTLRGGRHLTNSPVKVPCQNITSSCGEHGECRVSEQICKCDNGYFSMKIDEPCAEKGESQTVMAVIWYLFGWTGASAFVLGWTALGVSTLLTCCGGCCGITISKIDTYSDKTRGCAFVIGFCSYLSCFVLWIYIAVMISTSKCVDKNGVPCKTW